MRKKLHLAGLIVGLAGVVSITVFFVVVGEAPFTSISNFRYAFLHSLIFSLPFLFMVGIAYVWPMIGGILLIAASLFWPVWRLSTVPTIPPPDVVAITVLPVSLLPLISGILFLLSRRGRYRG